MKEFVKKKAVIVKDRLGLPNYMTMFYMEPGTYNPEDVPEMFKIRQPAGKPKLARPHRLQLRLPDCLNISA